MIKIHIFTLLLNSCIILNAGDFLKNTDFSSFDLRNGTPTNWNNLPPLSGLRVTHPDNPERFALRLASPEQGKNAFWIGNMNGIETGKTYRASARVTVPVNHLFRVYVERSKPEFKAFNGKVWQRGTGTWQEISFEFNFDSPGSQPYIVFCVPGTTECLMADVQIIEVKK